MIQEQECTGKCSGWVIDSVIDHIIGFSKYYPLSVAVISNFQNNQTPHKKGLINIQINDDNESFVFDYILKSCKSLSKRN